MWQNLRVSDNKRGLKAQTRTKIERQLVATSPSREYTAIAAKTLQAARRRAFEQRWLGIELIAEL
jgi:hypothetical protein